MMHTKSAASSCSGTPRECTKEELRDILDEASPDDPEEEHIWWRGVLREAGQPWAREETVRRAHALACAGNWPHAIATATNLPDLPRADNERVLADLLADYRQSGKTNEWDLRDLVGAVREVRRGGPSPTTAQS